MNQAMSRRLRMRYLLLLAPLLVAGTAAAQNRQLGFELAQCLKDEMAKVAFKPDAQRPKVQIQLPFVPRR